MEMRARKAAARGKQVARPAAESPKAKAAETVTSAHNSASAPASKLKQTESKPKAADKKAALAKEELEKAKLQAQAGGAVEAKPSDDEEPAAGEPRAETGGVLSREFNQGVEFRGAVL